MKFRFRLSVSYFTILIVSLFCLAVIPCFGHRLGDPKFQSKSNVNSDTIATSSTLVSPKEGILTKKLRKRIKIKDEEEEKPVENRQIVNIETFFNQFDFLNFNSSNLFSNSDSSSSATPTRFVIFTIQIPQKTSPRYH